MTRASLGRSEPCRMGGAPASSMEAVAPCSAGASNRGKGFYDGIELKLPT